MAYTSGWSIKHQGSGSTPRILHTSCGTFRPKAVSTTPGCRAKRSAPSGINISSWGEQWKKKAPPGGCFMVYVYRGWSSYPVFVTTRIFDHICFFFLKNVITQEFSGYPSSTFFHQISWICDWPRCEGKKWTKNMFPKWWLNMVMSPLAQSVQKSPRETHPRVLFQRMIVFIWTLFHTILRFYLGRCFFSRMYTLVN